MHAFNINLVFFVNILFCVSAHDNELASEHSLELTQSLNLGRQEFIQETCNRLNLGWSLDDLSPNQLEHILVDDDHKLLYCYVPKVACTNWKRILMILTGKWNDTDALSIEASLAHSPGMFKNLSNVPKEDRDNMLENYHKMIIVRNPFERILSAFRNKMEGKHSSAKYFQDRIGRRIIKAFRENPSNESLEYGNDVTFKEFVLLLTSKSKELADVANNEHWQPIANLCHPCIIKYTLVGKYETFVDDSLLALHTINASHIQFPRVAHTAGTADKLYSYFSQLKLPLIRKLYRLYKNDFKMFNYNLHNVVGFDLG